MDEKVKSVNVAYQEEYIKSQLVAANQLQIKDIYYGTWSGRQDTQYGNFQDIVIIENNQ